MAKAGTPPPKRPSKSAPKAATASAPERPRGGNARAIADLMPHIGRQAFRRFGFVQSSIVTRWPEIAGPRYAAVSQPDMIKFPAGKKDSGTLFLTVSGAHAPMLQHVGPELVERVNRFFGYQAITRIKMTQGTITRSADDRPPERPPVALRPVPRELGDSLRDIGDDELRTVLERMAAGLGERPQLPKIS